MEKALEQLQTARAILESERTEAKARYDKAEKKFSRSRTAKSYDMRLAWYEYRVLDDMIKTIDAALQMAVEYPKRRKME